MRMQHAIRWRFVAYWTCGFFAAGLISGYARAQAVSQSEAQFQQLIRSTEGPDLFRAYCASCHGSDAKGHGPAAGALKSKVPNLTVLASNNAGQFPSDRVRSVIMGADTVASHGSREMPVWGPIFHQIESDVDRGNVRSQNLVKYLESIQSIAHPAAQEMHVSKPAAATSSGPSGAELYKQNCAVCHGNDLKGNVPAPPPFKERTPDLTALARHQSGKFPAAYVTSVLRSGVKVSAHGPAEMPIWGATFAETEKLDDAQLTLRITRLVNYIKSLQAK